MGVKGAIVALVAILHLQSFAKDCHNPMVITFVPSQLYVQCSTIYLVWRVFIKVLGHYVQVQVSTPQITTLS